MVLSKFLPRVIRDPLRRFKRCVWYDLDELVLARDLLSYSTSAMAARVAIDVEEPKNPLPQIIEIDPKIKDTANRFLNCGFRAMTCRTDGVPAGYIWLHDMAPSQQHPSVERFEIQLKQDDIYLFNFYVAPEFRKGGVAGAFFARVLSRLRDDGFKRAYGFVAYHNIPARWTYFTHGWQTVDRFTGSVVCNAVLFSNRGVFYNTSLLGKIDRRRRRVVSEFLPIKRLSLSETSIP
jgi:GNAT superfamily N-acetyltransferase